MNSILYLTQVMKSNKEFPLSFDWSKQFISQQTSNRRADIDDVISENAISHHKLPTYEIGCPFFLFLGMDPLLSGVRV